MRALQLIAWPYHAGLRDAGVGLGASALARDAGVGRANPYAAPGGSRAGSRSA